MRDDGRDSWVESGIRVLCFTKRVAHGDHHAFGSGVPEGGEQQTANPNQDCQVILDSVVAARAVGACDPLAEWWYRDVGHVQTMRRPHPKTFIKSRHSASKLRSQLFSRIPHSSSALCIESNSRIPHSSSASCIS